MAELIRRIDGLHQAISAEKNFSIYKSYSDPGCMYSRDRLLAVEIWKYVKHRQTAENGELPIFGNVNQLQTYIVKSLI